MMFLTSFNINKSMFGNPRQPAPFTTGTMADDKLDQQLALYKSPATIRDTKQVYFYVAAQADVTNIDPLLMRYGIPMGSSFQNQFYYTGLGTTKTFNIADKVNDLIDLRIPKDKYMIEINLVECGIEADPGNWVNIPDRVLRRNRISGDLEENITFRQNLSYANPDASTPPRQTFNTSIQQAAKVTAPQTLYCRIKELANGEPYNWSVTNSGAYSIDKMHQMLVRHGDIDVTQLTLEFGHLVFTGRDDDNINQMQSNATPYIYKLTKQNTLGNPRLERNVNLYRDYKYLDYNSETFNVVTADDGVVVQTGGFDNRDYPSFYKGEGGINYSVPFNSELRTGTNLIQPVNRPPFYIEEGTPPYLLQGKPLLFNQQVAKLGFRFLIRLIHTY